MLLLFPIKLVKLKIGSNTVTIIIGKRGKLQRILSDAFKCIEAQLSYVCRGACSYEKKIRSAPADFEQQDTYIVDVVAKLK